jgi:protein SCO1/2
MFYSARILGLVLLMTATVLTGGCRQKSAMNIIVATSDTKIYNLRGKVVTVDATTDFVTVDHEAIPGFMDAMTMSYKLKDANVTAKLHPGDHITAKVLAGNDDSDVQLDEVVITAQQISDHKSVTK